MKRSAVGSVLAAVAVALGLASCAKNTQQTTTTDSTTTTAALNPAQKLDRGRYLSAIAGCNDCHTPGTFYGAPDMSRQLSGSELGWTGPWGTSYAANITPDSATGIGRYTEDDIVNALRKGVKKSGAPILPPMPWPDFAQLSDEDAYAVAAYIKSVPAVVHAVPANLPPGRRAPAALVFPPPPRWDAPHPSASAESAPAPGGTNVTTPTKPDTM